MKTHELLSDPSKWAQGRMALDERGHSTLAEAPEAARWCIVGAVARCYEGFGDLEGSAYDQLREALIARKELKPDEALATWNDNPERKFQQVKDLLIKLDI